MTVIDPHQRGGAGVSDATWAGAAKDQMVVLQGGRSGCSTGRAAPGIP